MVEADGRETLRSDALERVSDAIVSLNNDLEYTFVNPQAERLLDASEKTLRGRTIWEAFPETANTVTEREIRKADETGEDRTFERYNEALDRWFEVRVYPGEDGLSVFFTDVSERRAREAKLERYGRLIEAMPVGVGIAPVDASGRYELVNEAIVEMLGAASKAEMREYSPGEFCTDAEESERIRKQLREDGVVEQYEVELSPLEGEPFWASITANLVAIEGSEYIIGFIEDISERKAERREIRSKTRAVEAAPIGISLTDPTQTDNPLTYVNERFEEMTGYPREEILGRNCRFLQGEGTDGEPVTAMREAIDDGESVTVELRNYRKDGESFRNRVSIAPVKTDEGVEQFVGFQRDVTERRAEKRELRERKERIAAQNEALQQFVEVVTDAGRATEEKLSALLELGVSYFDLDVGVLAEIEDDEYAVREVVDHADTVGAGATFDLSKTFCSLVYDADEPVSFHTPADGGVEEHPAYETHDLDAYVGVPVWVDGERYGTLNFSSPEPRSDPFTAAEESFVRLLAQWIGRELEREKRAAELERTSEFLRATQEVAHIGGWRLDLRSETLRWSDEVYRIHGLPVDATVTTEDGIEFYHPDDRGTLRDAFEGLTSTGEPYDLELRIVRPDGEVRWVRTRGEPRYEDDDIVAVQGAFQDVTERKERERELQRQNDRLNEFASVVSHDLRNPLNVAQARAAILQERSEGEYEETIWALVDALERMQSIVEDTLTLARQGNTVGEVTAIPAIDLVGKCWASVETSEATLDIDDEFVLRGDRDRLRHVFENLFRNAVEHGGDGVTVRVGRTGEDGIYVEDDGPGIPPERREEVFKTGQTFGTDGTGFGLAIAKRVVEAHGWEIGVTESRDGGARFEIASVDLVE